MSTKPARLVSPLTNRIVNTTRDWAKKIARELQYRENIAEDWLKVIDYYGIVVHERWHGYEKKEYENGELVVYTKLPDSKGLGHLSYIHYHIEGTPEKVEARVKQMENDIPFVYGIAFYNVDVRDKKDGWVAVHCSHSTSCD